MVEKLRILRQALVNKFPIYMIDLYLDIAILSYYKWIVPVWVCTSNRKQLIA